MYTPPSSGRPFFCRASFQERQPGVEHASEVPCAPDPETLESSVEFFANFDHPASKHMHTTSAIDMRHVDGPIWVRPAAKRDGHTLIWFKIRGEMPAGSSQLLHRAMLAYATDQFMLEPVMRMHGMFWLSPDISLATLDHAIWWHRDVDMSDWVLAELDSPFRTRWARFGCSEVLPARHTHCHHGARRHDPFPPCWVKFRLFLGGVFRNDDAAARNR